MFFGSVLLAAIISSLFDGVPTKRPHGMNWGDYASAGLGTALAVVLFFMLAECV